jgi:hypothetical protein
MNASTPAAPPPIAKITPLAPKDHGEARDLPQRDRRRALPQGARHGELRAAFRTLSQERFRPPGIETTRRYSVATL